MRTDEEIREAIRHLQDALRQGLVARRTDRISWAAATGGVIDALTWTLGDNSNPFADLMKDFSRIETLEHSSPNGEPAAKS